MRSVCNCFLGFSLFLLASCSSEEGGGGEVKFVTLKSIDKGTVQPRYTGGSGDTDLVNQMWYLDKDTYTAQTGQVDINLGNVHDYYRGEGQIVIVSDNRIDLDHPDLSRNANVARSKDYTVGTSKSDWLGQIPRGTGSTSESDDAEKVQGRLAHGTAVAGVISMVKDNSEGMFGVAPNAELRGYNFLVQQKYSILLDQLGADVTGDVTFNYNYGTYQSRFAKYGNLYQACIQTLSEKRENTNIIYVKGSGNWYLEESSKGLIAHDNKSWFLGNANFDGINALPYIIVVGALGKDGTKKSHSSPGSNVWISAPGEDISSSDIEGCTEGFDTDSTDGPTDSSNVNLNPSCSYAINVPWYSLSTALVTGAVVLMREACPECTWRHIKHVLAKTATKIDDNASSDHPIPGLDIGKHKYQRGWTTNAANYNFHNWYGFGNINVRKAITYLEENKNDVTSDMGEAVNTLGLTNSLYYYTNTVPRQNIPDNTTDGLLTRMDVDLHNLQIEHVMVNLKITHPRPADLGIELISPSGTVSQLTYVNSGIQQTNLNQVSLGSNAFYGEPSLGEWTLKVIDGQVGQTGILNNWNLKILGHKIPGSAKATPAGVVSASVDANKVLSWTLPSDTTGLRRVELCILKAERTCQFHDWLSVPISSTSLTVDAFKDYDLGGVWVATNNTKHYKTGAKIVKMRTVDNNENVSAIQTFNLSF